MEDFNKHEFKMVNIFRWNSVIQTIEKCKKNNLGKIEMAKELNSVFMWQFWSKAEYEIVISPLICHDKEKHEKKIDIYDQIKMNFPIIVDMVWNYLHPEVA